MPTGPALFGAAALLAAVGWAACQKPHVCPSGFKEEAIGDQAVWCTGREAGQAVYYDLYPGTRRRKQGCPFARGALHGEFEGWHPDGKRWLAGHYQDGKLDGKWEQWNETGGIVAQAVYREGRLVQGAPVAVAAICDRVHAPQ